MPKASIDSKWEDSSFDTPEEFQRLKALITTQEKRIEQLLLSQKVLSTLCRASSYEVSIMEFLRDNAGEIVDYTIEHVDNIEEFLERGSVPSSNGDLINQKVFEHFRSSPGADTSELEFSVIDPSGKERWVFNKILVSERAEDGGPRQVFVITQDISAKKITELDPLEKQRIISSITDASPDILFIMELPSMALIYVNRAVNDIFRLSPQEVIDMGGEFIQKHTHPEDRTEILDYFRSVGSVQDFSLKELYYRISDAFGQYRHIRCRHSIFKVDRNGLPVQLIGVKQDITEHKRLQEKRLQTKIKQQQHISSAIVQTQEEERKRIAEVLHNSLGQVLYGVQLKLNILDVDNSDPAKDNEKSKATLLELIESAIRETRTISFELMPATLEDFGLETAIKDILRNKLDQSPIKYKVYTSGLKNRLSADIEIAIFRIVQELVNNVIKHSEATKTELNVNRGADYILIKISDNGKGFCPEEVSTSGKGFGLRSINNRVKFLNGKISYDCTLQKGSLITIDIPL